MGDCHNLLAPNRETEKKENNITLRGTPAQMMGHFAVTIQKLKPSILDGSFGQFQTSMCLAMESRK